MVCPRGDDGSMFWCVAKEHSQFTGIQIYAVNINAAS